MRDLTREWDWLGTKRQDFCWRRLITHYYYYYCLSSRRATSSLPPSPWHPRPGTGGCSCGMKEGGRVQSEDWLKTGKGLGRRNSQACSCCQELRVTWPAPAGGISGLSQPSSVNSLHLEGERQGRCQLSPGAGTWLPWKEDTFLLFYPGGGRGWATLLLGSFCIALGQPSVIKTCPPQLDSLGQKESQPPVEQQPCPGFSLQDGSQESSPTPWRRWTELLEAGSAS